VLAHDPQLAGRHGRSLYRLFAASQRWLSPAAWACVRLDLSAHAQPE
jgi:hypothetical protein